MKEEEPAREARIGAFRLNKIELSGVGDSQLLRESRKESEWALADATGTELPVQGGLHAEGDFLQMSGDRL